MAPLRGPLGAMWASQHLPNCPGNHTHCHLHLGQGQEGARHWDAPVGPQGPGEEAEGSKGCPNTEGVGLGPVSLSAKNPILILRKHK